MSQQLRARFGFSEAAREQPQDAAAPRTADITEVLPGHIVGENVDGFFLCRQSFSLEHRMGDIPLGAALRCQGQTVALSACDDGLLNFSPQSTCFMDTETTGLAGGAGTIAFLVGMGFFEHEAFVLEQCFLRDYDDEGPMLAYLSERLQGFTSIVSYNGKSFDLPLLRARFVQHRIPFPLEEAAHYDLVHAARRVWKRRLSDCSLNNIEQAVLGFHRQDDVPGYLIPRLWLDYLDTNDARPLEGVFRHHAMDILSLAALAGHLSIRLGEESGTAFRHAEDELSVIRLHFKRKQYDVVLERGVQFLETNQVADALRRECMLLMGQSFKRTGAFEEMEGIWRAMHAEYPDDARAAEELAKCLEHRDKNIAAASQVCRETLAQIERNAERAILPHDFGASALRGRLARLERKTRKISQRYAGDDHQMFGDDEPA